MVGHSVNKGLFDQNLVQKCLDIRVFLYLETLAIKFNVKFASWCQSSCSRSMLLHGFRLCLW